MRRYLNERDEDPHVFIYRIWDSPAAGDLNEYQYPVVLGEDADLSLVANTKQERRDE